MGSLKTVDDVCAFYKRVLVSAGLVVQDDGGVFIRAAGKELPLPVEGRNLAIPTKERLAKGFTDTQAFAPLGESINRTESIVQKKLRQILTVRQTTVIGDLMAQLMTIAADVNLHKTLSPQQAELLSVLPEVDEKTVKAVSSVFDCIDPLGDRRLVSTYVKRNGVVDGAEYMRAAIVTFDILRTQVEKEATIYGKSMRVKDKKAFFALLEFMLPGCKDPGKYYSAGSKCKIAPNLHALMHAHLNVMETLNVWIDLFRDKLEEPELLYTPDISVLRDELDNLKQFNGLIPPLAGNQGDGEAGVTETAPAPAPSTAASVAPATRTTIGQSTAVAYTPTTTVAPVAPIQTATQPMTYAQQQAQRQAQYYAANPQMAPQPLSVRQQYEQQRMMANVSAAPAPHVTIGRPASGYVQSYQQPQAQPYGYVPPQAQTYQPATTYQPPVNYVPYTGVR